VGVSRSYQGSDKVDLGARCDLRDWLSSAYMRNSCGDCAVQASKIWCSVPIGAVLGGAARPQVFRGGIQYVQYLSEKGIRMYLCLLEAWL
jgi:hypothetical protein